MNAPFIPCRRLDPLFRGERALGDQGEGDLTAEVVIRSWRILMLINTLFDEILHLVLVRFFFS